ncbi:MAG: hypothetical protein P8Y68_16715 [Anaerolineales bacterium]|jgi:hypothetical protein
MKRTIAIFAVAIAAGFLLAMASPAHADNAGAPAAGCQPGAGNDLMGSWQLLSLEEYAQLLVEKSKSAPSYEQALARATATYAFCDKNGDNYACVMTQNLPNDANGSDTWFLIEDNHPFGGN